MATARIHSFESFGTLDGPGIRFVVFFQGCPLRCQYCHNPDTWNGESGDEYTVEQVMEKIRRYIPYFQKSGGGVTASGGEPLMQAGFLSELFHLCKEEGIHTALDTSGSCSIHPAHPAFDALMEVTDLVLLDIKHMNPEVHKKITGSSNKNILDFA
ncbi:MAG: radical SAM protein, partial [Treponemataceae bacterium]|nr:radical SAM protein [Treponemataceae bacterium]